MNRSLAHVENIKNISVIDGADNIECAHVLGWNVVVKKGQFKEGQKVIFFEIDSWVPRTVAPFLCNESVREYNGVDGVRLRTKRMRGVVSQGLVIDLPGDMLDFETGFDVTEQFNIQKWEQLIPANLSGNVRGNMPSLMRKTSQERIQNIFYEMKYDVLSGYVKDEWIIQEKLEGSSMQVARLNDCDGIVEYHVASRNWSLKLDQVGNSFINTANECRLIELLSKIVTSHPVFSIQGELIGPGIQGNIYNLNNLEFMIFDIWTGTRFLNLHELMEFKKLASSVGYDLKMVPMHLGTISGLFSPDSVIEDLLSLAEMKSSLNKNQWAEGIVVKNVHNPSISFKVISNKYLLKSGN